jgi:hypothetical protein
MGRCAGRQFGQHDSGYRPSDEEPNACVLEAVQMVYIDYSLFWSSTYVADHFVRSMKLGSDNQVQCISQL